MNLLIKVCILIISASMCYSEDRFGRKFNGGYPFERKMSAASVARQIGPLGGNETSSIGEETLSNQTSGTETTTTISETENTTEQCVDKVVMVEEIEYDEHIECHHSFSKQCHSTFVTNYETVQEEECEENFRKNCFIQYKKKALEQPVKFCHTPMTCGEDGNADENDNDDEEETINERIENLLGETTEISTGQCKTVYETECETRYHEHEVEDDVVDCKTVQDEKCMEVTSEFRSEQKCSKWPRRECTKTKEKVKKYSPETECRGVPRRLCGSAACKLESGTEICFNRTETIIQEIPEETCNLVPQNMCRHVTRLVPQLRPVDECVDVPKEVCSRSQKNPRMIQKPIIKKWCYTPKA